MAVFWWVFDTPDRTTKGCYHTLSTFLPPFFEYHRRLFPNRGSEVPNCGDTMRVSAPFSSSMSAKHLGTMTVVERYITSGGTFRRELVLGTSSWRSRGGFTARDSMRLKHQMGDKNSIWRMESHSMRTAALLKAERWRLRIRGPAQAMGGFQSVNFHTARFYRRVKRILVSGSDSRALQSHSSAVLYRIFGVYPPF